MPALSTPEDEAFSKVVANVPMLEILWQTEIGDFPIDMAWSQVHETLAVAGGDGAIYLMGPNGRSRRKVAGHALGALALAWSPDGTRLASGGQDGRIRLWSASISDPLAEAEGGAAWVELLGWAPDGSRLATGSGKLLRVWDPGLSSVHSFAHPSTVSGLSWPMGSDRLVTSSYGGLRFWNAASGKAARVFSWKGSLICMRVSPDGKWIVCGSQDASVHIWKTASGEGLEMSGYPVKVKQLSWSADSRYLATGGGEDLCIWDFSGKGPAGTQPKVGLGHVDVITDVAFQAGGYVLASVGRDGAMFVWDARRPKKPLAFGVGDSPAAKIVWSPKADTLVVAYESGKLIAWRSPRA